MQTQVQWGNQMEFQYDETGRQLCQQLPRRTHESRRPCRPLPQTDHTNKHAKTIAVNDGLATANATDPDTSSHTIPGVSISHITKCAKNNSDTHAAVGGHGETGDVGVARGFEQSAEQCVRGHGGALALAL